ncbi:MAG: Na+/H+ antiporter NhaC family protein, partial [Phormidesmis sp. RL_2_1]|nr:Na+/H+ antiporter NhaC family protein [Phormidesmis sp. RL_2_1]
MSPKQRSSANHNIDLISALLVSFSLLVTSALTGTFIAYPLIVALILLIAVLMRRGFALTSLFTMGLTGAKQALPVVNVLLLVGIMTAVWMAAGTVPALVYYGTGLISPRFFILWAFGLTSAVSVLLGTSFGAVGTLGIALMVMARSGQVDVNPVAGAIIAGAFVGDRCSPMSSSAHLVASITQTSLYSNLRNMVASSRWPMALSILFYSVLSLLHPMQLTANPM